MINADDEDDYLVNSARSRGKLKARVFLLLVMLCVFGVAFVAGFFMERSLRAKSPETKHSKHVDNEEFHRIVKSEMKATEIRDNLKHLTSVQHIAGSKDSNNQSKEFIFKKWAEYLGSENVALKKYNVLLSYPKTSGKVSIVDALSGKTLFVSQANETRLYKDEFVPNVAVPFNAYSAAKNVKGKLLYVNYGTVKDFGDLEKLNISCKGKILVARYGKNFRGNKVALAEAAGAIGMIIYTDPANYASGKSSYPDSWWMPADGVQRGTVKLGDGDPLTPGYPSTDETYRIKENETALPNIPVQPISYQDALPLIRLLDGQEIPADWKDWKGGLNATYRLTMSENNTRYVYLNVSTTRERRDIYNVIGTVRGHVEPDRIVVVGNHHDAWVMGAVDPSSGSAVLMEVVRAVDLAVKKGWKPRRTLMFCNWDAEEYGLVGSTEWIEDYMQMLESKAVAYLNTDCAVNATQNESAALNVANSYVDWITRQLMGNYSIDVKASSQLANMVFETAKLEKDPDNNSRSVYTDWVESFPDKLQPFYPRIRAPGAGSDHKTFYMRLGIPIVDIRYTYNWDDYNHAMSYPVYHSIHDSFHWMTKFVDPEFKHHLTLGRIWAQMAMKLTDQVLLPFNFTRLAWKLSRCHFNLKRKYGDAFRKHGIKLDKLENRISNFNVTAGNFHKKLLKIDQNSDLVVRMSNDQMMQVERSLISKEGLPGRPFTKNVIFAPAQHDQYSGSCFPGVTDALYDVIHNKKTDWTSVEKQLSVLSYHILQATRAIS